MASTARRQRRDGNSDRRSHQSGPVSALTSALASYCRFHIEQYNETRWRTALLPAMMKPTRHCALITPFVDAAMVITAMEEYNHTIRAQRLHWIEALSAFTAETFPPPQTYRSAFHLTPYYLLDPASLLAVTLLNPRHSEMVLDMCAAPGGKSVGLISVMFASLIRERADVSALGQLTCNEFSQSRRKRLQSVLREYVPSNVLTHIKVTGADATTQSRGHTSRRAVETFARSHYDCILIDAPCSSDRHVLNDAAEMCQWTVARVRQCAERQLNILTTAIAALKPNGRILYATCALSHVENDDVVEAAVTQWNERHDDRITHLSIPPLNIGRATQWGHIILPDDEQVKGYGPLYVAMLHKQAMTEHDDDVNSDDQSDTTDDKKQQDVAAAAAAADANTRSVIVHV